MNILFIYLIKLLHLIFLCFVIFAPFTNIPDILLMHSIVVPFMVLHWLLNNNTCVLTLVERQMRKHMLNEEDDNNCFTCQLIEPVYDLTKNNNKNTIIYLCTLILFFISAYKVFYLHQAGKIILPCFEF